MKEGRPELKRSLNQLHVWALALGCIIGFGCFVLPGDFLAKAGPAGAAIGIALGGLLMVVIAKNYGVMVSHFPVAGGEFAYAYYACGRYHAYICGWFLALGYLSIIPLNATALAVLGKYTLPGVIAQYRLYTVAGFDVFGGEVALSSAAIIVFGWLHFHGVKKAGSVQLGLSLVLVGSVFLTALSTFSHPAAPVNNWQPYFSPDRSPILQILSILAIAPWLYVGFDTLPQAAEEIAFSPARATRLMAIAILGGAAMYVVTVISTAVGMPWQTLTADHLEWSTGAAVRNSAGVPGLALLTMAVCMAICTGINGFYMACSRLLFSMSRARILPAWFSQIHPLHETPSNAILFVAAISLLAPWFGRQVILWVVDVASLGTAVGYLYTSVAAHVAIGRADHIRRDLTVRSCALAGSFCSVAFIALLAVPGMPAFMAAPSWLTLAGWVGLGGLFYLFRAGEYRRIQTSTLDYLILGHSGMMKP